MRLRQDSERIYLKNRLNSSDSCEAAVTASASTDWVRFREHGELLV